MPGTTANDTNDTTDVQVQRARRRRRLRLAGAGVAAAIALGVAAVTTTAATAAPTPPDAAGAAELQAAGVAGGFGGIPNPGPGFRVKSVYKVTSGTQTYTCADTGTWGTGSVPEAQLRRYLSRDRIHHFGGPRWASERDGSTIVGKVPPAQSVPKEGTIPWLLLEVAAHEGPAGELSPVTHISRIRTTGGVVPTGTCTPGQTQAVPYGADYVFWTKAR